MDVDDPAAEADDAPRLTVLGATVQHAIDHVEVFPAPDHVAEVRIGTEELASRCPVTSQPDLSSVEITYVPDRWCVESKSLKLYLWSFHPPAETPSPPQHASSSPLYGTRWLAPFEGIRCGARSGR